MLGISNTINGLEQLYFALGSLLQFSLIEGCSLGLLVGDSPMLFHRYYLMAQYTSGGPLDVLSAYETQREALAALMAMQACVSSVDLAIVQADGRVITYVKGRRRHLTLLS